MFKRLRASNNGILLSLCSVFFLSVMGLFVKLASSTIPSAEISFFRGSIGLFIIVPYMLHNKISLTSGNKKMLVLRGLLGGVAVLLSFYAISKLKLSEASILNQTIPVFVIIFARIFLKEKLPKAFYFLMLVSIIGALLVIKPNFNSLGSFPAFVALLSAVISAIAYVCIKSLRKDHSTYIVVLYFTVTAAVAPIPFMVNDFVIPDAKAAFFLLMVGVVATLGQFFMTKAYGVEKAGLVSMVNYTGVFMNMLWDLVVWGVVLDVISLLGGLLIILSSVILTLTQYHKDHAYLER